MIPEKLDELMRSRIGDAAWERHLQERMRATLRRKNAKNVDRVVSGTCMTAEYVGTLPSGRRTIRYVPAGARCRLPIPLLIEHREDKLVGSVVTLEPTDEALHFTAIIHDGDAWEQLQEGRLRGVSRFSSFLAVDYLTPLTWLATGWTLHEISLTEAGSQADLKAGLITVAHEQPPSLIMERQEMVA